MANLWGKEIIVNEQASLLEDFSYYLETSMIVTIEKFKSIIILQKAGWLNDARDFLTTALPNVCNEVEQYLVTNQIMNPPNWKIFLKDKLEVAAKAGQLIYSYHEDCCKLCISQYQMQYHTVYEQELAKQEGLGFGIVSSSLAAHLVYAAQSVRKDIENEKKAREATDKIMDASSPIDRAIQMTIAFYHKKFDPFVVDFLVGFYSDIEKLIYEGLDADKEQLENNKSLSENDFSGITEANHREIITSSLSKYPFNGNALFWAIKYNAADDELIAFCSEFPRLLPKYLHAIKKSGTAFLKKQKEKADLYNRDPLTEDVIQILQNLRAFLLDERISGASAYDSIIQEVYGDEIDCICKKFDKIVEMKKNPLVLSNYAKDHTSIAIESTDFEKLRQYNIVFGTSQIADIFNTIPSELDDFNTMLFEIHNKIRKEFEKHQEVEKQRKQREREQAEQKQREEEQRRAEEQRQKELAKKRERNSCLIVLSLVAVIVIFVTLLNCVIIPNRKYNDAIDLMNSGKYNEAINAFEALDGYKDSQEQIKNCEGALKDVAYEKANRAYLNENYELAYLLFNEMAGYKDSRDRTYESAAQVGKVALAENDYNKAIEWYTKAGAFDEVKNVKYQYILRNKNNDDETTFSYLNDLKKTNYKDSASIFSELYSWKIEIIAVNSDPNSTQNKLSISKYKPVYIHFRLTGGTPHGSIAPSVIYTLPNGEKGSYDFEEYYYDGSTGWYGWSKGIYSTPQYGTTGTLTVTFYPYRYTSFYDPIGTATVSIKP